MPDSAWVCHPPLTLSQIAALRLAASNMTGAKRRAFAAEMPLPDCAGNPLQAARPCGWRRRTVALGLAERRSGSRCRGAQAAFRGRKRWEAQPPAVAASLRQLAESHAHHDPPCRPTLASPRLTANAAREAWRAQGYGDEHGPAPSTRAEGLKRRGVRLRTVLTAKPQKKIAQTAAIFDHLEKQPPRR
jgi:hypothetical protein